MAKYDTIREAALAWVNGFDRVPQGILVKLLQLDCEAVHEITPPSIGNRVYILDGEFCEEEGEISGVNEGAGERTYTVQLDRGGEATVSGENLEVSRYDTLPMWGMLWAFSEWVDNEWLENHGGLQIMADCGFRIYEQEDYEYVFGIDGAGYDFYGEHWIPLYKARGLHWHRSEENCA